MNIDHNVFIDNSKTNNLLMSVQLNDSISSRFIRFIYFTKIQFDCVLFPTLFHWFFCSLFLLNKYKTLKLVSFQSYLLDSS